MTITHGDLLDRLTAQVSGWVGREGYCYSCVSYNHDPDCYILFIATYIMQSRGWYHAPPK